MRAAVLLSHSLLHSQSLEQGLALWGCSCAFVEHSGEDPAVTGPRMEGCPTPSAARARHSQPARALSCQSPRPHGLQHGGARGHHAQRDKPGRKTNTGARGPRSSQSQRQSTGRGVRGSRGQRSLPSGQTQRPRGQKAVPVPAPRTHNMPLGYALRNGEFHATRAHTPSSRVPLAPGPRGTSEARPVRPTPREVAVREGQASWGPHRRASQQQRGTPSCLPALSRPPSQWTGLCRQPRADLPSLRWGPGLLSEEGVTGSPQGPACGPPAAPPGSLHFRRRGGH